jgi:hypothetical protein
MSMAEAARRLGCTVGHVEVLIERGELVSIIHSSERKVLVDPDIDLPADRVRSGTR